MKFVTWVYRTVGRYFGWSSTYTPRGNGIDSAPQFGRYPKCVEVRVIIMHVRQACLAIYILDYYSKQMLI